MIKHHSPYYEYIFLYLQCIISSVYASLLLLMYIRLDCKFLFGYFLFVA